MNNKQYIILSLIFMLITYIAVLPIITIFKFNKEILGYWVIVFTISVVNLLISFGYIAYKYFKD
jgi:hypothetical protein